MTDLSFLDAPFRAFNSGKVPGWNTRMRISCEYDEEQDRYYLLIVCPPNLLGTSISNHTYLLIDDDLAMDVYQPAGGTVRALPVDYRYVASLSRVEARIGGSQPTLSTRSTATARLRPRQSVTVKPASCMPRRLRGITT